MSKATFVSEHMERIEAAMREETAAEKVKEKAESDEKVVRDLGLVPCPTQDPNDPLVSFSFWYLIFLSVCPGLGRLQLLSTGRLDFFTDM